MVLTAAYLSSLPFTIEVYMNHDFCLHPAIPVLLNSVPVLFKI